MTRVALYLRLVLLSISALLLPVLSMAAQEESVLVEGDTVRIHSDDDDIVISGAWRKSGKIYTSSETDQALIDLGAHVQQDRILLNLAGDVLFSFNSSEILPGASAKLSQIAALVRGTAVGEVYIIGHTDSVGSADYNQKLSQQRALSVIRWLNKNEQIPASLMIGSGMGARQPVDHNTLPNGGDNPEGRARNRRVEIQMARTEGVKLGPGTVAITENKVTVATPSAGNVVVAQDGDGVTVQTDDGTTVAINPGAVTAAAASGEKPSGGGVSPEGLPVPPGSKLFNRKEIEDGTEISYSHTLGTLKAFEWVLGELKKSGWGIEKTNNSTFGGYGAATIHAEKGGYELRVNVTGSILEYDLIRE